MHDEPGDATLPPELLSSPITPSPPSAPRQIGPYRLLQRIGEGGMGEVYLAEQDTPIRRKVAFKLVKPNRNSKEIVARFEAERQALALMEHPCIAKVLDAGEGPDGRPYIVMEYVDGVPITDYCDQRKLSLRERLQLFIRVCEAIQHAHQKAIIHRDLKPSNILVQDVDGRPEPRIIDFGVAKALADRLTEETMHTQLGLLIGTPEYMSPEQAEVGIESVDTRADIYSLGVLLYQILIGVLPLESKRLRGIEFHEFQRRMRQEEPSRPSTRLQSLAGESVTSAERRSSDPGRLADEIRGDLDWITMKALEKDRNRRYASANEFAMDIRRYLNNEPVLATPPSAGYRLQKLYKRHRATVVSAALLFVVLLGATIVSTILYARAQRAAALARTEAARSEQVAAFMRSMLQGVGPSVALGRDTKLLREILDQTALRLGTQLRDQPLVRADLLSVLGSTYRDLGEYQAAEPHLREALALLRATYGPDHPQVLEASATYGYLDYNLGRFEAADSLLSRTAAAQAALLGPRHPSTLTTQSYLVPVLAYGGRYEEATKLGESILESFRAALGDSNETVLTLVYSLAQNYADQEDFGRADSTYKQLISDLRQYKGDEHPMTLAVQTAYGWMLRLAQRQPEAEVVTKNSLETMRRVLGNDHNETQIAVNNLGIILNDLGRPDEAEPYYIESFETGKRILGEKHPETVTSMVNLGSFYLKRGKLDESAVFLTRAIEIFDATMPADHIGRGIALAQRGEVKAKRGQAAEAQKDLLAAFEILSKHQDLSSPRLRRLVESIAVSFEAQGAPNKAAEWRAKLPKA